MAVVVPACGRAQADRAGDDHEVVPGAALGDASAALGEEEGPRCDARDEPIPELRVVSQSPACGLVNRHEAGFAELGASDGEDAPTKIHIATVERERLAET